MNQYNEISTLQYMGSLQVFPLKTPSPEFTFACETPALIILHLYSFQKYLLELGALLAALLHKTGN